MLNPYTAHWLFWKVVASPRRVFGGLRLLRGFARSAALGKILTLDNLRRRHVILWTDVACARGMENMWTTFFIVMWLPLFGVFFSIALGCLGLCL
jgi:hypothetical protein